ncbi:MULTISPECIES: hypothetical protein [Clostridium]|uniref:hypothetical protein n=1 Tax=Clostridium TaxID=1485 RepID=UPI00069CE967|nr:MULTISPECIES: hypothetical protein [Clostridium]KOF56585.1 hypothetical protein AGR56_07490 [Clostridium sp. DMHC 10]MCD2345585.1 hypothetical protein [Clostridium guangxiense]
MKKVKYISIVFISIILAMIFHIMASNYSTTPKTANWSFLVKSLGLIPTIIIWYVIAYGSIAYIFYKYEDKFVGTSITKGLRYGISIGILWLWGMLIGVLLYGNSFVNEFVTGVCDAVPIVIMGLLLGKFTTKSNHHIGIKHKFINPSNVILSLLIFSIIFSIGCYLINCTGIIKIVYQNEPYFAFIWPFLMGTCIGITYLLLGNWAHTSSTKLSSTTKFGAIIFGANWLVFAIFMPFIFSGILIKFIISIIVNILSVILSCYLNPY